MGQSGTAGSAQQQMDRASGMDRDRMAGELSGAYEVRDRRGRTLSAGQVTQGAKAAVTTNGLTCDVIESALRGVTNSRNDLWEVACAGGTGFMIASPKKEEIYDCSALAAQAKQAEAAGQQVPAIAVCVLKANQPKP